MKFLKIGLLFAVTGIFTSTALAQEADLIWSPELSYSWKQSDRLGFTAKFSMFNSLRDLDNNSAVRYIEPQLTFSYSSSPRVKLGGGYYYRNSTPFLPGLQYEHRFLEQIGFVSYIGDKRIAHRLRAEQRLRSSSYQNRIRYRLSYDFPLEGQKLDAGEKYFILKMKYLKFLNNYSFVRRIYSVMVVLAIRSLSELHIISIGNLFWTIGFTHRIRTAKCMNGFIVAKKPPVKLGVKILISCFTSQ
mgnify:CR=1 FL=1